MTKLALKPGLTKHAFGEDYARQLGALPGGGEAWVDGLRQAGRAVLSARGLPGPKEEAWRYTPLGDLAKVPFIPAAAADDVEVSSMPAHASVIQEIPCLVLVNGVARRDLSDVSLNAKGMSLIGIHEVLNGASPKIREMLGKIAIADDYPMAALNAAYMADGLSISVADKENVALQIISIGAAGAEPVAFHPRFAISVGENASLTLVHSHIGLPGQSYFANPVTEIDIALGGSVRHYVRVNEDQDAFHASVTAVRLAQKARYEDFRLGLGGGKVRQDIAVTFTGSESVAEIHGGYALDRGDHYDTSTVVNHVVPSCASSQMVRGVVSGKSHAVFQGRIHVARAAQKTDARQNHKALFLNAGPSVDVKPELEIFADDVQCAHGAATGEIDPNHIFYLMSRGIDPETARALLIEGFLDDVIDRVTDDAVRESFIQSVSGWLRRRAALEDMV